MKKYNEYIKEDVVTTETTEPVVKTETETVVKTEPVVKTETDTQFIPPSDKKLEEIIKKEAPILKNE